MWQLTAKYGKRKGRSWAVQDEPLIIGRNPTCTIQLRDPHVSREHCVVRIADTELVLEDLGSSNTTLVNGSPSARHVLRVGDEIAVGEATFIVTQSDFEDTGTGTPIGLHTTQRILNPSLIHWDDESEGHVTLTIAELALLHRFANRAAACRDAEQLFTALTECIAQHCSPPSLFMVPAIGLAQAHISPPGSQLDDGVRQRIDQYLSEEPAHPDFNRIKLADGQEAYLTFIPLRIGEMFVGVFGGTQLASTPGSVEPELHFAQNLARVLAPFLYAFADRARKPAATQSEDTPASAYLGESELAQHARRLIVIAANAEIPILIQGETGTGKELAAQLIHDLSRRDSGPFVTVNCAALTDALFESEVFGHVKGAFTDAHVGRDGLLAEAHGGHLFLDEVADLSLHNQARLLRAIETRTFRPVGASEERESDFFVVSASNRDLWGEVEANRFREDLYYRLAAIELFMPPLSERPSDIPQLVHYFAAEYAAERNLDQPRIDANAMAYLKSRPWRGNVRELRNSVNKISSFANGSQVTRAFAEQVLARQPSAKHEATRRIDDVEREHIEQVMVECGGRIQDAAEVLGIHRNTLSKKLKEYRQAQ